MGNYNKNRRESRLESEDMDYTNDQRNEEQQHKRNHRVYPTNDHRNDYASGWRGNDNYNSLSAMNSDLGNDYAGGQHRSYGSGQGTYQHRDYGYGSNQYGSDNYGSGERGYNQSNAQGRSYTEHRYGNNNQYNNRQDDYNSERWQDRGNSSYQNRHAGDGSYYGNGGSYTAGGQNYAAGNNNYDRDYSSGNTSNRSMWDRGRDEVSSWFGDQDAERRRRMDHMEDHRGRGPKGYKRSDERITEDINDRLSEDPYVDASEIEVSVNNGEVTLSGTVNDRGAKRRAEDIAESVSGVGNVENRIRMQQENSSQNTLASTSAARSAGKSTDKK